MAIAPTGAMYKSLSFDGEDSRDYGVYITGEAVYNAPERDVEMITIPGRNGSFALDNGRFENIEVSYPAGIFAETEADFRQAISDFRNFLCSRKGYVRLQDEYNPNEYRMAVYKSGLEVDPAQLRAGEFEITFDCKPQRYLTSGESAVSVTSGDTITNPTLFEAGPLLEVEGYGTIEFNGYEIELINGTMGDIEIFNGVIDPYTHEAYPNYSQVNTNDTLTISNSTSSVAFKITDAQVLRILNVTNSNFTVNAGSGSVYPTVTNTKIFKETFTVNGDTATYGTVKTIFDGSVDADIEWAASGGTSRHSVYRISLVVSIGNTGVLRFSYSSTHISDYTISRTLSIASDSAFTVNADSSVTLLGQPTYVDCDLGEAYKYDGEEIVSLNRYIDLGSDLPKLAVGENEVTFDNTITDFKITPRWWKI